MISGIRQKVIAFSVTGGAVYIAAAAFRRRHAPDRSADEEEGAHGSRLKQKGKVKVRRHLSF